MAFSGSLSGKYNDYIPAPTIAASDQNISKLSGAIGKLSSAGALSSLAQTAKTVAELPIVESPIVTAATAKATYKSAIETALARQDEAIAVTYKYVFDTIKSTADAGVASMTIPLTTQQQSELIPLLERNGYTVTVTTASTTGKAGNTVEIKWA